MKVMVNSIPKGGTHLLLKLIYLLGVQDDPRRFWLGAGIIKRGFEPWNKIAKGSYRQNTVQIGCETPVYVGEGWLTKKLRNIPDGHSFGAHCIYSEKLSSVMSDNGVRIVCVLRDPRAIVASHMHYIKKWKKHFFHKEYMALPSDEDRMLFSITGGHLGKYMVGSIRERYIGFKGWLNDNNAVVVKFEDIVGKRGGGSNDAQLASISTIADHLGLDLMGDITLKVQNELFGNNKVGIQSDTFRKGRIDSWRDELSQSLLDLLDAELSDILAELGY